jgi:hypothetical protein
MTLHVASHVISLHVDDAALVDIAGRDQAALD